MYKSARGGSPCGQASCPPSTRYSDVLKNIRIPMTKKKPPVPQWLDNYQNELKAHLGSQPKRCADSPARPANVFSVLSNMAAFYRARERVLGCAFAFSFLLEVLETCFQTLGQGLLHLHCVSSQYPHQDDVARHFVLP